MPGQQRFIELAMQCQALKFGDFTLKSGRRAPYFFNMGCFIRGQSLAALGQAYATRIVEQDFAFDVLFGPAYKGIPLVSATAIALSQHFGRDVAWCFNRKEAKDHGEGGIIVGAPLQGRVLLLDDVITAGTAVSEVMPLIEQAGATVSGMVIALDRQEQGVQTAQSAVAEVSARYQFPITSLLTLTDLIAYLSQEGTLLTERDRLQVYQQTYGCE